jgi:hypothetical protein
MHDRPSVTTPELAGPVLAPLVLRPAPVAVAGVLCLVIATASIWLRAGPRAAVPHIPATAEDLSAGMVTPVAATNPAAVAAAVSMLRLPATQRADIEREVLDGRRRLGWIVLTDSMDPDGDTVAVEAGGIVQHVVLSKAWMPVAIPLDGGPIAITAVKDGGGGGVTVGVATRGGPVTLRIMLPGERMEVMP